MNCSWALGAPASGLRNLFVLLEVSEGTSFRVCPYENSTTFCVESFIPDFFLDQSHAQKKKRLIERQM